MNLTIKLAVFTSLTILVVSGWWVGEILRGVAK